MMKKRKLMARVRAARRRLAQGHWAAAAVSVVTITPWEQPAPTLRPTAVRLD